ncbi:thiolase family protein [Thermodesulfobacteriota bacterium]
MGNRVAIVGVGQTDHSSSRKDVNGRELIYEAVSRALIDADITIDKVDAFVIGNMDHFEAINYTDMWSIGGSGAYMKPIFKVCTGGTTGTSVATSGFFHVASGLFDVVLAIAWEKNSESDTTGAIITATEPIWDRFSYAGALPSLATEASAYMEAYGITERDAALVSVRDRKHACNNPHAHLRQAISVQDVLDSPMLSYPIKFWDICPRSDGACAVVFASEHRAEKMCHRPAWIQTTQNRHDYAWLSDIDFTKMETLKDAAAAAYEDVGITEPLKQIDVMELYLPYSYAGLKWIEVMGLAKPGESPRLIEDGVTDMDGELPINPSGGVISTNCIGATGLLRVAEIALQLMGRAEKRQVPDAKVGLATGFGGAFWSDVLILGDSKPV